ncbi:MAG: 2Fe-2S iron-sulfur cluster-binding protein, partial [Burkholderiaceae bacterium]|nr:2Fe-2S iron-sulfur cluster-binding protein [Burkholderiaceae bacterium]
MSEFTVKTTFTLNGVKVEQDIAARQHLVDFLRDCHDLTGSHLGCEHGVCGACQVMVDGQVVRGCLTLAVQMQGR